MYLDTFPASGAFCRSWKVSGFLLALGALTFVEADTLPAGANVSAGEVSVFAAGRDMTVRQTTDRAVINWRSFSIGAGHAVNFVQPTSTSVMLNRVVGGESSVIQGALTSNGRVFLLNPNGIVFTPGSQVNVGGILASTLSMTDRDFLDGRNVLSGAGSAAVINQGNIVTRPDGHGGFVALVAAKVVNDGRISAPQGGVILASAGKVKLDLGGVVNVVVEGGVLDALVANGGAIVAPGGDVLLIASAADELPSATVNHTGLIEAQTLVTGERGRILLLADMDGGMVRVGGRLDVSAPDGGDGGFIETSAGKVDAAEGLVVSALAPFGRTGRWLIDPDVINVVVGGSSALPGLPATGESAISPATLNAALSLADVDLQANSHIDFISPFSYVGARDAVLSLYAPTINVGADISSDAGARLSLNFGGFFAGNGFTYAGNVYLYDAAAGITTTRTLSTAGGSVVFNGNVGGSQNLTILAGSGNVTHNGTVDGNFTALVPTVGGSISLDFKPGHPNALVSIDYTTQQVFSQGVPIAYTGNMPLGFIRIPAQTLLLNAQNSIHGTPVFCVMTLTDGTTVSFTPLPNGHVVIPSLIQVTKIDYYTANASAANFTVNPVNYDTPVAATKIHQYLVRAASVTLGPVATVAVDGDIAFVSGRFINNAGTVALVPGAGLGWRIWSTNGDPFNPLTGDDIGGLVYDYKQYDLAYTSNAAGLLGVGSGLIYTFAPQLTVSLVGSVTKPYDGLATATNIVLGNYLLSGAVGGDAVTLVGVLPTSGTYYVSHDVGTGLPVSVSGIAAGISATNLAGQAQVFGYGLAGTTASGDIGIITPVGLTITANPDSKTYDGIPYAGGNGVTYAGLVNGETPAVLSGSLTYGGASQGATSVGSYELAPGGLSSSNYSIVYVSGLLTIGMGLDVVDPIPYLLPPAKPKPFGAVTQRPDSSYPDYLLGGLNYVYAGLPTDIASAAAAYSWLPEPDLGVLVYEGGALLVRRTPLTITSKDIEKIYDAGAFSGGQVTYAGFLRGETPASLGGRLVFSGTSQGAVEPGRYIQSASGQTSPNYDIAYVDGTLVVRKAPLLVTSNDVSKIYDNQPYAGGAGVVYSGFVSGQTSAVLGGELTYGGSAQGAVEPGRYVLLPRGYSSPNYQIAYKGGTLTILPGVIAVAKAPPFRPAEAAELFATLVPTYEAVAPPSGVNGSERKGPGVAPTSAIPDMIANLEMKMLILDAGPPLDPVLAPRTLRPPVKVNVLKGGLNLGRGVIIVE